MDEKHGETFRQKVNGKECVVTYLKSDFNLWQYIYITPRSQYLRSVSPIVYIQLSMLIIALFLGGFLIVMLVKSHYRHIKRFVDMLPNVRMDGTENEYKKIEEAIRITLQTKNKAIDAITANRETMQNNFLADLLSGKSPDLKQMDQLEFNFTGKYFFVLSFYLNEHKLLFIDEKNVSNEEKYSIMCVILKNIFGEALENSKCWYRFLEMEAAQVCIINLDGNSDTIYEALAQTRKNIEEYFYVSFGTAISRLCDSPTQLNKAYEQSLVALDYLQLNDENNLICFDDIKFDETEIPLIVPNDMDDIVNCLRDGSLSECLKLVHILLDKYNSTTRYSPVSYRFLFYNICAVLIQAFHDYIEEDWIREIYKPGNTVSSADLDAFIQKINKRLHG